MSTQLATARRVLRASLSLKEHGTLQTRRECAAAIQRRERRGPRSGSTARGLMSEAAPAGPGQYFGTGETANIRSRAFHFNTASLAILRKMGFVVSGRSRAMCLARGKEIEHIDAELTREAFEDARK